MRNLVKGFLSGFILTVLSFSLANAEIKSAVSCSGKCTYYYDTVTHDMRWEKNKDVPDGEEVIIPQRTRYIVQGLGYNSINNLTIGEGITGLGENAFWSYGGVSTGNSNSTLVLPSTLKSNVGEDGGQAFHYVLFGTIDASALKDANMYIQASANLHTLIMDENSNSIVTIGAGYQEYPSEVSVQCKGKLNNCMSQVKRASNTTHLTPSYYVGPDENGNWEVWSDEGKAIYTDSSMQKPLSKYDFDGNQIGSYKYDAGGNLVAAVENGVEIYRRRIYTPAEATAAVSGKNTFKIQYR